MPLGESKLPARRRRQRENERVRRAGMAPRQAPGSPIAAALAQIAAAFDETAIIAAFKMRVERAIELGPHHAAVRARFGARATMLAGCDLDAAIGAVERWWRDERKAYQIASALGCGTRLSLDVLGELRLTLRWLRFKRMQAEYEDARAALDATAIAAAAAE
jgi:hypothetical protein